MNGLFFNTALQRATFVVAFSLSGLGAANLEAADSRLEPLASGQSTYELVRSQPTTNVATQPAFELRRPHPPREPRPSDWLSAEQLADIELDTLSLILEDAATAKTPGDRVTFLEEFLTRSGPFLRAAPSQLKTWLARGAVALEVDNPEVGWEVGKQLASLSEEAASSVEVRSLLAKMERKGWLGAKPPPANPALPWVGTWDFLHAGKVLTEKNSVTTYSAYYVTFGLNDSNELAFVESRSKSVSEDENSRNGFDTAYDIIIKASEPTLDKKNDLRWTHVSLAFERARGTVTEIHCLEGLGTGKTYYSTNRYALDPTKTKLVLLGETEAADPATIQRKIALHMQEQTDDNGRPFVTFTYATKRKP